MYQIVKNNVRLECSQHMTFDTIWRERERTKKQRGEKKGDRKLNEKLESPGG